MEKRTIVAIVLIFVIYWFSSQFLWKPAPVEQNLQTSDPYSETVKAAESKPFIPDHMLQPSELLLNHDIEVNDRIILENDKLILSFSNLGAVLNQVVIKDFFLSDKISPVELIPENQAILQTNFSHSSLPGINETPFNYERTQTDSSQTIIFYIANQETNAVFKKIFTVKNDYHVDFYVEGENLPTFDSYSISVNSGINITEDNKAALKDIKNSFKFIGQIDRESKNVPLSRLNKSDQTFSGKVNWAAVRSKYFVMSLIPENRIMTQSVNTQRVLETLGFELNVRYNTKLSNFSDLYSLYLGPVDYDKLKAYNNGMENIAELGAGWLRPLAKIFMFYIGFLYKFIPNYGIVIIIFAFTLKVILTPLTNKSLHSGKKLQKIQPYMREIQTKYKTDIKKQQEELRKLYKEHNVSPLGGCLPLLLQMPIFFALYPVLRSSIEFRQASFFAWLTDLSEPDPYWILPILMGVFMFFQQKMMQTNQDTSQMDEKQAAMAQSQKMMTYMMPPFMVFIFSSLPAGLVLYWTTFNVFSIIQQYYINKKHN